METLMDLGINAEAVQENDGSGGRQIVPQGKYKAVMVARELKDNNAGTGKVFETTWQIVEGPHADVILKNWWNVKNPNETAQNIGLGTLKRVCRLTGVPFPPPDETQMFGKPVLLTVTVKPDWKDPDKKQNDITAYNPIPSDFVAETTTPPTFETHQAPAIDDEPW